MTTIDELGRQAGAAARADASRVAAARVESGLEQLRAEDGPIVALPRRAANPRRWLVLGTAAALIAAAVVALVINANESEPNRLIPAEQSTQPAPSPTPTVTTVPPTAETAPTSSVTSDTTPVVVDANAISVAYDALPPAYAATPILGMTDQTQVPLVAIGDTRIVAVTPGSSTALLIDPYSPSETPQPVQLDVAPVGNIVSGPGDVLYAVVQAGAAMSLDAIALSGPRAGQVLVASSISSIDFAQAPSGVLGHGPAGIIDRRTGDTLLSYVDENGVAVSIGRPSHEMAPLDGRITDDFTVHDPDGAHDWHLTMKTASSGFDGNAAIAPSSHGGGAVWAEVGEDAYVVAVLAADGTGTWYSLTDGWQVASSDLDGTILVRMNGGTVELARLDPPQRIDFLNQPAAPHQRLAFAATLPTSLTSADACTIDDLDVVPSEEGAMGSSYGIVNVRNKSDKPCSVSGVADVALIDDAGNVVQSTDPSLLNGSGSQPVILETDSWASSLLGQVASNVCGGNQSSQLRLTIGSQSTTVPFAVGGPLIPNQCTPDAAQPPTAGKLPVEAFAPIQPNDAEGLLDYLQFTIEAPTSVKAGDLLQYDVVVTDPGDPFVFDQSNCPVYTESAGTATAQLLLSCNGSDGILINTGESVRFHLELPIPADAVAGAATLTWAPIEPTGTPITAAITITP